MTYGRWRLGKNAEAYAAQTTANNDKKKMNCDKSL